MYRLHRLGSIHMSAVLAFEQDNRSFFAQSISDRGDDFFERFRENFGALVADQESGGCAYDVLVAHDGAVVGRFNLYRIADGTADVGYRVGRDVAGRGVATSGLRDLCRIATAEHGLRSLRASTSSENLASRRVLLKAGFVPVGPTDVAGRLGMLFELMLPHPEERSALG